MHRNFTTDLIRKAKEKYYTKLNEQLSDPSTCSKKWCGYIKSAYNRTLFTSVPPLREGPEIVSDTVKKVEMLNTFFL